MRAVFAFILFSTSPFYRTVEYCALSYFVRKGRNLVIQCAFLAIQCYTTEPVIRKAGHIGKGMILDQLANQTVWAQLFKANNVVSKRFVKIYIE